MKCIKYIRYVCVSGIGGIGLYVYSVLLNV